MRHYYISMRLVAAILLGACAALPAGVADAASTYKWTSAVSGTYSTAGFWTRTAGGGTAPPVAGDTANFNEAGAYTITFNANAASDVLYVTAGTVGFGGNGGVWTYSLTTGNSEANISGATLNLGTSLSNPLNLTVGGALDVESNAGLNVKYGSVVSTSVLYVGVYSGTANSVLVDGGGLGASGGRYLGYNGARGDLTYQNSSAGIWGGTLYMAESAGGGTGNLTVQSGSQITIGSILAATSGASGAAATITVSGTGSMITQSGASSLTLGSSASSGAAVLNISSNGTFNTGTGLTTVNKTGTINVTTGGSFAPKGNITVSGGAIDVDSTSSFQWNGSRTLTVNGGGRVTLNSSFDTPTGATVNISGTNSKVETPGVAYFRILNGAQVNVTDGGALASGWFLDIGIGGNGTLVADGTNSSVNAGVGTCYWGAAGNTASVTFRNGATCQAGLIMAVSDNTNGNNATVSVESGAHLAVGSGGLYINNAGGTTSGSVTVTGASSEITHAAGSSLTVGADTGYASLSVYNNATYTVQDDGYTYLNKTGYISVINGANVHLGYLVNNGGYIAFGSGLLDFSGPFFVGLGGVMGSGVMLDSSQRMSVHGITTIGEFSSLTLNGGTFWTDDFNPPAGTFRFNSGTFGVGMSGLGEFYLSAIGPNVTVNPDCYFIVSNKAVLDGLQRLTVSGGRFQAQTLDNSGMISVDGGGELNFPGITTNQGTGSILVGRNSSMYLAGGVSNLGEIILDGGTAAITGPGTLNNTGLVRGDGRISGNLINYGPGEIRAEAGKRLRFDGTPNSNEALLSLQGGTLEFTQPLTNDATGAIMGRGTLIVGGTGLANDGGIGFSGGFTDVYGKLTNNRSGKVIISGGSATTFYDDVTLASDSTFKVSDKCSATFFGSLSGAISVPGTGTVYNEGDLRPGFSPAAISFGGNLVLGSSSSTEIELSGTTPGAQFDTIAVTSNLTMGGTLEVKLIDDFTPTHNDSFRILTYGSMAGAFDAMTGLNPVPRLTLVPTTTDTDMTLTAVQDGPGEWRFDAGGNASVGTNWTAGRPNGVGDVATFGSVITATRNVSVDAPTTLGGMVFDNANNYAVTEPAALTLQNTGTAHATVTVSNSGGGPGHNVSANVTLASPLDVSVAGGKAVTFSGKLNNAAAKAITKTGLGAVTFSGEQTHGVGATLAVSAGTANLNSDAGSSSASNLGVSASGSAALNFGATQHLADLNLGGTSTATITPGGDKTVATTALTIAGGTTPTSTLDVNDNLFAINYTSGSPLATIEQQVIAGYHDGDWNGAGFTSALLKANPTSNYGIGYAENEALPNRFGLTNPFGDYTGADDTTALVRYTLIGDVNLDGIVNDADISLLTNNYGSLNTGWLGGDVFGYDGIVNDSDVSIATNNYGSSVGQLTGGISQLAAVPEPATLGLLALGAAVLLRRKA